MYFGDTEVWRTSTAEPTTSPGIRWMYLKDMTEYLYFWKTPQTLIFDLGNLVDDKYTGTFNTTLTATFLTSPLPADTPAPADLIIPISARNGAANKTSAFVLPADNATNTIAFPQNVNRAVFSVSANGQASEEFWWSNVLQSDVDTFHSTAGRLPGLSPFREVQVLIDGQLAGVWWPFPVVFTGGVVPSLHRPIVGLDAFDLREHEIDVSPWLSVLCDGNEHSFTILVAGLDDSIGQELALTKAVNSNWVITGKLFLWLDDKDSVTTGTPPIFNISQPQFKVARVLTNDSSGHNDTLAFTVSVERTIAVRADIKSQHRSGQASWSQFLTYSNKAGVTNSGYNQINDFLISGVDIAAGPGVYYRTNYDYPLFCNSTTLIDPVQGNLTIGGHLIQGLSLGIEGTSIFPNGLESFLQEPRGEMATFYGSLLKTSRDGIAWFFQTGDKKKASGFGSTKQVFNFSGIPALSSSRDTEGIQLYFRNVTAANGTVVYDSEPHSSRHLGQPDFGTAAGKETHLAAPQEWFAETPVVGAGPRAFMYRGHIADRAA
ncbi:peptide N-acetyl-beta-D-glucosaminyl asparaginase amidase A-domain-containing protein [Xylariales sp. PMI_506]|nr:peptide N-acetyl-beta-D-glucosaminyl asparaginase amidase A-domain-containing protein [Xylariales sp. PMI_506]